MYGDSRRFFLLKRYWTNYRCYSFPSGYRLALEEGSEMKLGVIAGCGYGASHFYRSSGVDAKIFDIDLPSYLESDYHESNIIPYFEEVIEEFKCHGITHGTVACNTFSDIGGLLLKNYGITPVADIADIILNSASQLDHGLWISTSHFKNKVTARIPTQIQRISDEHQQFIDYLIYQHLCFNKISQESLRLFKDIVNGHSCKNIIFACTDLSILLNEFSDHKIVDSASLHIDALRRLS